MEDKWVVVRRQGKLEFCVSVPRSKYEHAYADLARLARARDSRRGLEVRKCTIWRT